MIYPITDSSVVVLPFWVCYSWQKDFNIEGNFTFYNQPSLPARFIPCCHNLSCRNTVTILNDWDWWSGLVLRSELVCDAGSSVSGGKVGDRGVSAIQRVGWQGLLTSSPFVPHELHLTTILMLSLNCKFLCSLKYTKLHLLSCYVNVLCLCMCIT